MILLLMIPDYYLTRTKLCPQNIGEEKEMISKNSLVMEVLE